MVARRRIYGPFSLPSAMRHVDELPSGLSVRLSSRRSPQGRRHVESLTAERLRVEDSRRSLVTLMGTPLFQKIELKDSGVSPKLSKLHTNSS